jgi:quinate dehydrogenase (quinone)
LLSSIGKWLSKAAGLLLILLGIGLAAGGAYLASLGGSLFYAPAGIGMAAVGVQHFRLRATALLFAAILLTASIIWGLWEVGFDFWQLVPRTIVFLVIAIGSAAVSNVLIRKNGLRPALTRRNAARLTSALGFVFAAILGSMFYPHASISANGEQAEVWNSGAGSESGNDWPAWANSQSGSHYSQLDQINRATVQNLKVAWTFRTGDMAVDGAEYQGTPLKIDDTVYLCTPRNQVFALDAATGKEKWSFKPTLRGFGGGKWQRCRGVAYVKTPTPEAPNDPCQERILETTVDGRIYAIDARSGKLCPGFGDKDSNAVDLFRNMGPRADGNYYPTSAPLIAGDVIVVGGMVADNVTVGQPSGVVRAYDVHSGKIRWAWDPADPKRGAPRSGDDVYPADSPNFWGTASFDPKLNLIFVPTGNQTPDFWNGNRHPTSDEYNDSIVAIDAATGIDKWHFRTVNRDMFDYDVSSQPILYDMPDGRGGITPVVVQLTKRGQIFVLDRRNGKPVVPVENRPVPIDAMPGMSPVPVQPFSALSLGVEDMKESDAWGGTIFDQLACRIQFKKLRYEGPFTPLKDKRFTLMWPGYYGGFNWGGGAIDPTTGTLYVNDIRMAMLGRFLKREAAATAGLKPSSEGEFSEMAGTPWGVERNMFLSPLGFPCFKPPFGTVSAIDLKTLKPRWSVPMGTIADAPVHGITPHLPIHVGMPTLGAPIVTKGGLVFYQGSLDWYVRAMDRDTGEVLWKSRLPVGAQGAPMTYMENGKQFVVVTAGGATRTGSNDNRGDYVIAYALP